MIFMFPILLFITLAHLAHSFEGVNSATNYYESMQIVRITDGTKKCLGILITSECVLSTTLCVQPKAVKKGRNPHEGWVSMGLGFATTAEQTKLTRTKHPNQYIIIYNKDNTKSRLSLVCFQQKLKLCPFGAIIGGGLRVPRLPAEASTNNPLVASFHKEYTSKKIEGSYCELWAYSKVRDHQEASFSRVALSFVYGNLYRVSAMVEQGNFQMDDLGAQIYCADYEVTLGNRVLVGILVAINKTNSKIGHAIILTPEILHEITIILANSSRERLLDSQQQCGH